MTPRCELCSRCSFNGHSLRLCCIHVSMNGIQQEMQSSAGIGYSPSPWKRRAAVDRSSGPREWGRGGDVMSRRRCLAEPHVGP